MAGSRYETYGPSGAQAKARAMGLPFDRSWHAPLGHPAGQSGWRSYEESGDPGWVHCGYEAILKIANQYRSGRSPNVSMTSMARWSTRTTPTRDAWARRTVFRHRIGGTIYSLILAGYGSKAGRRISRPGGMRLTKCVAGTGSSFEIMATGRAALIVPSSLAAIEACAAPAQPIVRWPVVSDGRYGADHRHDLYEVLAAAQLDA